MIVLLLLALTMLLIGLFLRVYRKNWSRNLSLGLRFSRTAFTEGESGVLSETVTNKKLMPFWWGDIQYHIPEFIRIEEESYHGNADYMDTVSVFSYEKLSRSVPFTALRRGYFRIGEAQLLTQDLFFRYRMLRRYPVNAEIYVYPDLRAVDRFSIDFRRITGEVIARRNYIEDPFEFRGIRDYYPFDSLKSVNWNATARTGTVKVNEYHHTSSQEVCLLLDFDAYSSWDRTDLKEGAIRVAARLASDLIRAGIPVGIVTNAADVETGEEVGLPCKNGLTQREAIFRNLSRLNPSVLTRPFLQGMEQRLGGMGAELQLILISYNCSEELRAFAAHGQAGENGMQWIFLREPGTAAEMHSRRNLTVCEVK